MKVHEAAAKVGASPRALRFYEEKGLIAPVKQDDNGYRLYNDNDVERLRWIVSLRELGMSIPSIRDALHVFHEPAAFLAKVDEARSTLYEEWLTMFRMLRAFDDTLTQWQGQNNLSLVEVESAASKLRSLRNTRDTWTDQWDFDGAARQYGPQAPLAFLQPHVSPAAYEASLKCTIEWLDPGNGEKGLELGAGSGNLTCQLAQSGAAITAIEQSSVMLALLRQRLPQVDARRGNMLGLPLASASYHFAATSFAMQCLNRQQQLLALHEMDRVLMDGGRLVISGMMHGDHDHSDTTISPDSVEREFTFTLSHLSELTSWLRDKGYRVITRHVMKSVYCVIAVKPRRRLERQGSRLLVP